MSGASSVSFCRSPAILCSMAARMSLFAIYGISSQWYHPHPYLRFSLVGSTSISMTYSIKIQPYNDPYIKIAEEAVAAGAELLIPGAFLVDIIPILKYVPGWFPGAKFQRKAAVMRERLERIRNTTFAATEELIVCCSSPFLGPHLMMHTFSGQR